MPVQAIEAQEAVILSPIDFQALLNRLEPSEPIVEDGKLSPDWRNSETQAKWERVYSNQINDKLTRGYYEEDIYITKTAQRTSNKTKD